MARVRVPNQVRRTGLGTGMPRRVMGGMERCQGGLCPQIDSTDVHEFIGNSARAIRPWRGSSGERPHRGEPLRSGVRVPHAYRRVWHLSFPEWSSDGGLDPHGFPPDARLWVWRRVSPAVMETRCVEPTASPP
jgi:hypothetical protein